MVAMLQKQMGRRLAGMIKLAIRHSKKVYFAVSYCDQQRFIHLRDGGIVTGTSFREF